tara:strand:- start:416 stop:640 length:225 start_codon:yes stop_codon:yes gene_type:complete
MLIKLKEFKMELKNENGYVKVIKKVESKIQVLEEHIEFLKSNNADDLVITHESELSFLIGIRHDLWKEINQIGK